MKTRIHRFWLNVSLAASSIALPLSGPLRSHDLPTRWTSGSHSTSSWNYLLDECLDSPVINGLNNYAASLKDGCFAEDWSATDPAEITSPLSPECQSGWASRMAGWISHWQRLHPQDKDALAQKKLVKGKSQSVGWAARPDLGAPPAPSIMVEQLADTCVFEAEFQAMQSAAELLDREISRASRISADEASLARSLAAAAELEASAIDSLPASGDEQNRCGGELRDIVSVDPLPGQFVPGMIDGYMALDHDDYQSHWLGGLGKAWKLRTSLGAAPTSSPEQLQDGLAGAYVAPPEWTAEAFATPFEAGLGEIAAAELIEAPTMVEEATAYASDEWDTNESLASNDSAFADIADLWGEEATDDESFAAEQAADPWMLAAEQAWKKPDGYGQVASEESTAPVAGLAQYDYYHCDYETYHQKTALAPSDEQAQQSISNGLPPLKEQLAVALEWIEVMECNLAAELCGLDFASQLGRNVAIVSSDAAQHSLMAAAGSAQFELPPAVADPGSDIYVVYTDIDGIDIAVPGSLARAWNRPERDDSIALVQNKPAVAADMSRAYSANVDFAVVRSQLLSLVARQLDSLGITCLQTADHLSNWAETQIASREESDIR